MHIAFLGLGNMGLPKAENLAAAGQDVIGFDPSGRTAPFPLPASGAEAMRGAELVTTPRPSG